MQQQITLKLRPLEASQESIIKEYIAKTLSKKTDEVTGFYLL